MAVEQIKKNGYVATGYEALTGDQDFFTVRTLVNILMDEQEVDPGSGAITGDATSQAALDALIRAVSSRAQPVILGGVTAEDETDPADLPGADSGVDDTVFTLVFSVEHQDAWTEELMLAAFNDSGVFVNTTPTDNNDIAVVKNASL